MPQISKKDIHCTSGDVKRRFEAKVMYNQDYRFFIELPAEFKALVEVMERQELETWNIIKKHPTRYAQPNDFKAIVTGASEHDAVDWFQKTTGYLMGLVIETRPVIIIFFEKENTTYHGRHYAEGFSSVGGSLGLTYAVESTAGGTGKVYTVTNKHDHKNNVSISSYRNNVTIVDDTPANREVLERIHAGFRKVLDAMKEFTGDPEKIKELLDGTVKLLN